MNDEEHLMASLSPAPGACYTDSATGVEWLWTGTAWVQAAGLSEAVRELYRLAFDEDEQ